MTIEETRNSALSHMDRMERSFRLAFFSGALVELGFLVSFLLLADLGNRGHMLLLIATIAIYTIIVLGLVALGAVMRKNTLLILQGLEGLANDISRGADLT